MTDKATEKLSYSEAMEEVEKILARFNSGEMDVDTLTEEVKRATELITMCKERLNKVQSDVRKVLEENNKEA